MATDWDNYESGPFCPHWSEMGDCDECRGLCATCGHKFIEHYYDGDSSDCAEAGCGCAEFVSPTEGPPVTEDK